MLTFLQIDNVAVVEHAELSPGAGLHVLTGETGAGKSIIIDAINAVLGERTSRDIIRSGEKSAAVTAVFGGLSPAVLQWLDDNGIEPDADGTLIVARRVSEDGRALCRVNGSPVTVAVLKQLGAMLVNIHGQHDGQQLFDEGRHLSFVDGFAAHDGLLAEYRAAYYAYRNVLRDIQRLSMGEEDKQRRRDVLLTRIAEIESAELEDGEEEELSARRTVLRDAEKLAAVTTSAFYALHGEEDNVGAAALIADAAADIERGALSDPSLASLAAKLAELRFSAEDCVADLRDLRGEYDFSPDEADRVEGRLEQITQLEKRYGATISDVLNSLEEYRAELNDIEFSEQTMAGLKKQETEALTLAERLADSLTASRRNAADALQGRILTELSELDMPRARFVIDISPCELSADGRDMVSFLISTNAGIEPRPLSRIASGGELARIMLALKAVLAENDAVETLIFDEVDAGVSGRAAQRVAEKLAKVGRVRQVLCVTHLPQIAAMADTHLLIDKAERDGMTYTSVHQLDYAGRAAEVARIIGGATITPTTVRSAEEMISSAEEYKRGL